MDIKNLPCFLVYNVRPNGKCSCGKEDCGSIGKHPKLKNWTKQSAIIKQKDFLNNNYGMPTGATTSIVIVDVDPRNGGFESFERLEALVGELDCTWKVDTPSGGFHLYYEIPGDIEFSIRKQGLGKGIDLLAEGSFAVMVGSNHVKGTYKWAAELSPDDVVLENIPQGLLALLEEKENKRAYEDDQVSHGLSEVSNHKINEIALCLKQLEVRGYHQWLDVAMALHSIGNHGRKPFDLWIEWSQTKDPKNSWKGSDVRKWNTFKAGGSINYKKIFDHAKSQGLNPGNFQITLVDEELNKNLDALAERLTQPVFAPVIDIQPRIESSKNYIKLYDMDTMAGSFVQALIDEWGEVLPEQVCLALATQVIPSIVFQGLVCTPEMDGINTYSLFVGKQGTGKSIAVDKIARYVLNKIDHKQQMSFPVSGTAFGKEMNTVKGVGTLFKDEILDTLRKITTRDDGRQEYLLSLWSLGQGGTFNAQRSAKEGEYEFKAVIGPAFSMIGGGVERDWIEISNDYNFMSKGFGSRLEVITFGKIQLKEVNDQLTNYSAMESPAIKDCIERMKAVYKHLQDQGHHRNNRYRMKIDSPSKILIKEFHNQCAVIENEKPYDDGFSLIRLPQQAMKTATRIALMESSLSGQGERTALGPMLITRAIMKWSIDYVSNRHEIFAKVSDKDNSLQATWEKKVMVKMKGKYKNTGMDKVLIKNYVVVCQKAFPLKERWEAMEMMVEHGTLAKRGRFYMLPKTFEKMMKKNK